MFIKWMIVLGRGLIFQPVLDSLTFYSNTIILRERQTDRQTGRQAGRQAAGRQASRQAGRQTNGQTDRRTETERWRGKGDQERHRGPW